MDRTSKHVLTVCTSCRHQSTDCRPGLDLIRRLRAAFDRAGPAAGPDFEVSGTACLAGCGRPCTVAYRACGKTVWLFGDIDADEDVAALVEFGRMYADSDDGWFKAAERPGKLRHTALARVPAAVIRADAEAVQ
ncbi:DUF1636 domain-containing protein [Salipiger sp. IMCC34102]|uniref:DUF1636 family protein n=1 Tax=Salipiger sp. IMCC34102 TaxID=2510647 RepID=UPI00101DE839|nr:DUF1636 domain-containing protein [Salipiger sp. IMCC34102]RYH01594.1 DUF1636 domain-containing protein [Salipiger sp. IMCC34102]